MYLIYGKHKNDKQFRAIDLARGNYVGNLIFATMFEQDPTDIVKELNNDNEDWTFEVRKK